jgi:hypothetical protein
MTSPPRRFPAPWRVVELPGGFAVEDSNGQRLGTFYGRTDPNVAGTLTLDEAWRMAPNFAKLPDLLKARCRLNWRKHHAQGAAGSRARRY